MLFGLQKEQFEGDDHEYEVSTNYRYMRRKDELANLVNKKEDTLALETTDNKKKS